MDLFDGKLCRECQLRLEKAIRVMIQDDMHVLFHIKIDDLGQRLTQLPRELMVQSDVNARIFGHLANSVFQTYISAFHCLVQKIFNEYFYDLLSTILAQVSFLTEYENRDVSQYSKDCTQFLKTNLCSTLATVVSSDCLRTGQPIPREVWLMYSESLDTDVASRRLKLASTLYCCGDLQKAAYVLDQVAQRLDDSVLSVCGHRLLRNVVLSQRFCEFTEHSEVQTISSKLAFCVRFIRQEMFCTPMFMWFEMFRSVGDDVQHRCISEREWMDCAEVDARPFMLYLQYLTYRDLGERLRQLQAFGELQQTVSSRAKMKQLHHRETVFNLMGHCLELEGNLQGALNVYDSSLRFLPRNNAANKHILRLTQQMNV